MVDVKFARVRDGEPAEIPSKRDEDAGYDVYASLPEDKGFLVIRDGETERVPTNIASAIEPGYYFQVEERASTGMLGIKKSAGVIDPGYRGEWFIVITNASGKDLFIVKKECVDRLLNSFELIERKDFILYPYEKAIAQVVLHQVLPVSMEEVSYEELQRIPSERRDGAFGASGK